MNIRTHKVSSTREAQYSAFAQSRAQESLGELKSKPLRSEPMDTYQDITRERTFTELEAGLLSSTRYKVSNFPSKRVRAHIGQTILNTIAAQPMGPAGLVLLNTLQEVQCAEGWALDEADYFNFVSSYSKLGLREAKAVDDLRENDQLSNRSRFEILLKRENRAADESLAASLRPEDGVPIQGPGPYTIGLERDGKAHTFQLKFGETLARKLGGHRLFPEHGIALGPSGVQRLAGNVLEPWDARKSDTDLGAYSALKYAKVPLLPTGHVVMDSGKGKSGIKIASGTLDSPSPSFESREFEPQVFGKEGEVPKKGRSTLLNSLPPGNQTVKNSKIARWHHLEFRGQSEAQAETAKNFTEKILGEALKLKSGTFSLRMECFDGDYLEGPGGPVTGLYKPTWGQDGLVGADLLVARGLSPTTLCHELAHVLRFLMTKDEQNVVDKMELNLNQECSLPRPYSFVSGELFPTSFELFVGAKGTEGQTWLKENLTELHQLFVKYAPKTEGMLLAKKAVVAG